MHSVKEFCMLLQVSQAILRLLIPCWISFSPWGEYGAQVCDCLPMQHLLRSLCAPVKPSNSWKNCIQPSNSIITTAGKTAASEVVSQGSSFLGSSLGMWAKQGLVTDFFLSSAAGVGLNTKPFPTVLLPAWKTYQCPVKRQIRATEEVWELMSPPFADGWRQRENKWLARGRAGGKPLALAGLFASQFNVN